MSLKTAMLAALLAFWPLAAWASMENVQRVPTSASIPCHGQLKEHHTEGANVFTERFILSLTCEDAGKVAWTLRASAGCSVEEGLSDDGKGCAGPAADPVSTFSDWKDDGGTTSYNLTRYVFARNCDPVPIREKSVQANTNAVRFDRTRNDLLCKEVTVVDGTRDKNFTALKPAAYKYATVKTEGGRWQSEDGPDESVVLGTDAEQSNYSVSWSKGVMRRDD